MLTLAGPDASTVSAAETFVRHAEAWPITVGFFCFLALLGGLAYWLLFRFWPDWKAEQEKTRLQREAEGEKTRTHIAGLMSARGLEAKEEVAAERAAGKERHSEIVRDISGRVEKLHEDVRTISRKTGEIATKLGLPLAFLLACGALAYWLITPQSLVAGKECPKGRYYCGKSAEGADKDGCCEKKKSTAKRSIDDTAVTTTAPDGGHSLAQFASFSRYAANSCSEVLD